MIERDPTGAGARDHDLIVVGGGAQGVALALEAARRGRRPLLLERDDFGGGTTWNHLRIVHGGLRYLQKMDLARFHESVAERRWYLRHFPDLVRPMPCLMPLYGKGLKRPVFMRAALLLNDVLSARRNADVREDRALPRSELLGSGETGAIFPGVRAPGLKGGARWFDAVTPHPERLLIEQVRWACAAGATALNYVEGVGLLTAGGTVRGVRGIDRRSGRELTFRAPLVINAAGPWVGSLGAGRDDDLFRPSLAFNLLVRRPPLSSHAVAVSAPAAGSRVYFALPWHGDTLIGTHHSVWPVGQPLGEVPAESIEAMLAELEAAVPGWDLRPTDIARVYAGLLPVEAEGTTDLARRPAVRFHGDEGGPGGLVSVVGIKFTTARKVAEGVLDRALGPGGDYTTARPEPLHVPDRDSLLELAGRAPQRAAEILDRICREESVVYPEDLYLRRTGWGRDPLHVASLDEMIRSVLRKQAAAGPEVRGRRVP